MKLNPKIDLTPFENPDLEEGLLHKEYVNNREEQLSVNVQEHGNYVSMNFTSRMALYDFAKILMKEALYGNNEIHFHSLSLEGKDERLIVNGVRMADGSPELMVFYDD